MQNTTGLRTWGWAVESNVQELLVLLHLQYRKDFSMGNVREENGLRVVQIVAPCTGCEKETIDSVHAVLSFWNLQQGYRLGMPWKPSTLTGKVKPCRECNGTRTAE